MSKKFLNLITYVDTSSNDQIIDLQTGVSPNTVPLRDENGAFKVRDIGSNDDNLYVINKKYITDKLDALDSSSSSDTFAFGVYQTDGKITTDKRPLDDRDGVLLTGDIDQDVSGEKTFSGSVTFSEGATYSSSIDDNSSDLLLINKKYANKKLGVLSLDDSASASSFDDVGNFVRAAITKSKKNSLDDYLRLSTPQGESDQILSQPATFAGDNSFDSSVEFYRMLRSSEPSKPNDVINYNFYLEAVMGKDNLMLAKVESSTGGGYTIGVKKSPGLTKINWGDGSIEYIGSADSYEHTYTDGSTHYEMFYDVESVASDAFAKQSCLKEIIIPNGTTSIGEGAFENCSSLTSVTIPSSTTTISDDAFYGCGNMASLNFSQDSLLQSIGAAAFNGCDNLTNITIPGGVTIIGAAALGGCSSLQSITIPFVGDSKSATTASANTLFGSVFGTSSYTGGVAITQKYGADSSQAMIYYIPSSLRSVTITGGNLLYGAFYNCSSLTSITIPGSVTSIGDQAFRNCSGLTSITIPDSVEEIGTAAFRNCSGLTSITIPDSVKIIKYGAFYDCTALENITMEDGVETIEGFAFSGVNGSGLTSVTIPKTVKKMYESVFNKCTNLETATFSNDSSLESIGRNAFLDCSALWKVSIGSGVGGIEYGAFNNCTNLTNVTIPDSVRNIGDYAFRNTGLFVITIPDSVESIGSYAFYKCEYLATVIVTRSTPATLGTGAFDDTPPSFEIWVPSNLVSTYRSAWSAYSSKIKARS